MADVHKFGDANTQTGRASRGRITELSMQIEALPEPKTDAEKADRKKLMDERNALVGEINMGQKLQAQATLDYVKALKYTQTEHTVKIYDIESLF